MMNDFTAIGKRRQVAGGGAVRRKSLYWQDNCYQPRRPGGRFRRSATWLEV
jgi:ribosomal protein S6E (S10)